MQNIGRQAKNQEVSIKASWFLFVMRVFCLLNTLDLSIMVNDNAAL